MITAEDKTLRCRDCGDDFTFTVEEQQSYQRRRFDVPKRCKSCRADKRLHDATVQSVTGTVKFFDANHGYGFVVADGAKPGEPDVYVNFRQIIGQNGTRKSLVNGQRVEFTPFLGKDRKPAAANVRPIP